MGIPVFSVPGVEADDVLGTLAVRGTQVCARAAGRGGRGSVASGRCSNGH